VLVMGGSFIAYELAEGIAYRKIAKVTWATHIALTTGRPVEVPGALLSISLGEHPLVQPEGRAGLLTRLGLMGLLDAARRRHRRRGGLHEMMLLASNSGRYRGTQEELVPLWTDPYCAIPLAVVVAGLLRAPHAAARFAGSTVAAYSLTAQAIHRLRAWQHSA